MVIGTNMSTDIRDVFLPITTLYNNLPHNFSYISHWSEFLNSLISKLNWKLYIRILLWGKLYCTQVDRVEHINILKTFSFVRRLHFPSFLVSPLILFALGRTGYFYHQVKKLSYGNMKWLPQGHTVDGGQSSITSLPSPNSV